ncbi:MAG: hypothetical protein AVDCRST_MAG91-935 [uncultured Sphingomonadaceae bacterium]|uniref:Uncharacterized protein n=1 Tax=uncultured Sphingomonadaceae bacterium TaxID=169976 RepID=A0A6J4SH19_9SPHN|nr:MAG: hypothetical protein AVDCRST_MAG91-935 [uncultured Sphingomonadaceae bacterium]
MLLMRTATLATLALVSLSVGSEAGAGQSAPYASTPDWVIGPIIKGRNYSRGMPLHPSPGRGGAFQIELPQAPGSVHYVTFPHGSLSGKKRIVMRFRIVGDPGVRIVPRGYPQWTAKITPYFQRRGDNWTGRGRFETYRWYATFASKAAVPGEHQVIVPLNGNWTAVEGSSARSNPVAFREALSDAGEVGFVLGGGDGYGHGAYAIGRARLIVTSYRIE